MAREKWGLLEVPNTATRTADRKVRQLMSLRLIPGINSMHVYTKMRSQQSYQCSPPPPPPPQAGSHAPRKVIGNPKDEYGVNASVYVVQFNGFMSLIR